MTALALDDRDQMLLAGGGTAAEQLAMRIIVAVGEAMGAERLIDITRAHIDSCLYHGRAGLDFAVRLRKSGARVVVPTTLNVSSLDLLHPDLYRGDPETARLAREQMDQYEAMGCRTTWTCAPYQLLDRPSFGEHVAWAESNAIVFANSVLGARTHRYGDFIDICAALTGRVPDGGLHRTENRRGRIVFDLERLPASVLARDDLAALVGHVIGDVAGTAVPVIIGAPTGWTEDDLKALGAAGASSGAVAMFHAVGVTPEAATLEAALQGGRPDMTVIVTTDMLADARNVLSTGVDGPVSSVNLGTPHASLAEIRSIVAAFGGRRVKPGVECYVSTGRDVESAAEERGLVAALVESGVRIVVDTCTYITPIIRDRAGVAMTNSAKWAYYAPANLGVDVVFGSLGDCVESAVAGVVTREVDDALDA